MVAVTDAVVRCDCCGTSRPVSELFAPYGGAVRCRNVRACDERRLYSGTGTLPPESFDPPAPVRGTCAICGTADPPGGVYQRTPGGAICLDRPGCDSRSVEHQFLTAHGDDGQVLYTSAQMRAVALASTPEVVARPGSADLTSAMPSRR